MLKPLNKFIQIEPQSKEDFISSNETTYNEVGTVISIPDNLVNTMGIRDCPITKGDIVYFDSWMAAKFPAGEGKYYWLVPFENIKAYEQQISEIGVSGRIPPQVPYSKPTKSGVDREM